MGSEKYSISAFGIGPGCRVSLLGIRDAAFLRQVLPQVANPAQHRAVMGSDLIFLGVEGPMQLRRIAPLVKYLAPEGAMWLVYADGIGTVTAGQILEAIEKAGLESDQALAFSETQTALRATRKQI